MPAKNEHQYGTLWSRIKAFLLDYLLISLYLTFAVALGSFANFYAPDSVEVLFGTPLTAQFSGFLFVTLPISLYFIVQESSTRQGSWGKRKIGLRVVMGAGGQLTRGKAAVRTALKFTPWELSHLCIWQFTFAGDDPAAIWTVGLIVVWLLVGGNLVSAWFTPKHQALYDLLAGTAVVVSHD